LHMAQPDEALLRDAMAGDARAFAELCEGCRTRVWRIVCSVAGGHEADDLAQDAIVRAWCARRSYRREAPFEAWLCRIALNAAHDYRRSAWRRRVIPWEPNPNTPDDDAPPLECAVAIREVQRRVRQAVADLPERQRVPIWLHFIEGYTMAEVAKLELTNETTVRSRVQAARRRLRVMLSDVALEDETGMTTTATEAKGCGV
jgi:RNA polymerase sigma-70 factor, ECF subfamily